MPVLKLTPFRNTTFALACVPNIVIGFGLSLFAISLWPFSFVISSWGFDELFIPQALRGFALLLCIVPSVGMALNGLAPEDLRFGSGLFNLMRNLGGAVGIETVTTWLQDFGRANGSRLGEAVTADKLDMLNAVASRFSALTPAPAHARLMVEGQFAQLVFREALTLAFQDVFTLMAALLIVPFCKTPKLSDEPPPPAH